MTTSVVSGLDLRVLRATDACYFRSPERIGWLALTEPGLALRCIEGLRDRGLVQEKTGSRWRRTREGDGVLADLLASAFSGFEVSVAEGAGAAPIRAPVSAPSLADPLRPGGGFVHRAPLDHSGTVRRVALEVAAVRPLGTVSRPSRTSAL